MKNAAAATSPSATLTTHEAAWLRESGRFVRMVVQDAGGTRRCTQGIGAPKTSTVIGKTRHGKPVK